MASQSDHSKNSIKDNNKSLAEACIKILADAVNGMTTKDLAAALEESADEEFKGISSSILSSKLNAVFRRCENVSDDSGVESLAELPISRSQSNEPPKRLVYKYAPNVISEKPKQTEDSAESTGDHTEPGKLSPTNKSLDGHRKSIATITPVSSPKLGEESDENVEPLTPSEEKEPLKWRRNKRKAESDATPELPPITRTNTPPSTSQKKFKSHRNGEGVAGSQKQPSKVNSNVASIRKSLFTTKGLGIDQTESLEKVNSVNLYYDSVGLHAVNAVLDCDNFVSAYIPTPDVKAELDAWLEIKSPESLRLSELDHVVK